MPNKKSFVPVTLLLLLIFATLITTAYAYPQKKTVQNELPVVGSYENLKKLLANTSNNNYSIMDFGAARENMEAGAPGSMRSKKEAAVEHSTTNIQVQGVDEADIIKTDGQYIYQINKEKVLIIKAQPADKMKVVSTLTFADKNIYPREIYVDQRYLTIIGTKTYMYPVYSEIKNDTKINILPPNYTIQATIAMVYDITKIEKPRHMRTIEVDGNYLSSRKIGTAVYLVANKYIDYHILESQIDMPTPFYRDTADGDKSTNISYDSIRFFPEMVEPNYLLIAGFDLNKINSKAHVSTYLGSGQNIYVSSQHLYVAANYNHTITHPNTATKITSIGPDTLLYKFKLHGGEIEYAGKKEITGTVLNQFSMDEYRGYFRVATTKGEPRGSSTNPSKNNLYVLDQNMNLTGKIEDIAPGEKIYSVRYMGDRAYMVTFKTVDPLFVIGLKDPRKPEILGALKIPGYSDYLHPYDENHIIGFGKDTVETKNEYGGTQETVTYYQGMKMALFNVSDVKNPVEMFVEKIGDRGTDSELLRNHKALLFSKERNLLAFPINVMEFQGQSNSPTQYGTFKFQGAYVYSIDLQKGFSLRGKITHLSSEDYLKAGHYWPGSNKDVERIIYIGENLYTISKDIIKAHKLPNLTPKGTLVIN